MHEISNFYFLILKTKNFNLLYSRTTFDIEFGRRVRETYFREWF